MKNTILITGGTGLIGKQMISHFLKNDYIVVTTTRNKANIPKILKELKLTAYQENLKVLEIDFLEENCVSKFISFLENENLHPNTIIHNARSIETLKIEEDGYSSSKNLMLEYKIGVVIPYELTTEIIKSKIGENLNNVIFISSIYGVVAPTPSLYDNFEHSSAIQYGLTKSAQIHLTKELAVRLSKDKIRVNCVSFGGIKGRANDEFIKKYESLNPQQKMMENHEVIAPINFLVTESSIGMTGHNLIYDSGWTIW